MLERMVLDAGGTYLMCDTDSMAIVASERGGLVPCVGGTHKTPEGGEAIKALSWIAVKRIVDRFKSLNPYNKKIVPGSILNIVEEINYHSNGKQRQVYGYGISAKRYARTYLDGDEDLNYQSERARAWPLLSAKRRDEIAACDAPSMDQGRLAADSRPRPRSTIPQTRMVSNSCNAADRHHDTARNDGAPAARPR